MAQATQNYNRSMAGSIGAGMKSLMGGSGRRFYVLEHKVSSKYHKAGENQRIIVDQIELGRDPRCQVRFDESFTTVSRRHAAIVKDGDNWKLIQLSKTNPTYLNGHRVDKEWYLQNGDEIQLSTNGPRMGFIVPEGDKSLVKSIGLSARLSLFRQQALRPYKQALTALGILLVLCIGVGSYFIVRQSDEIKGLRAENIKMNEDFNNSLARQRDKARQDSITWAEENQRMQQQHEKEISRLRNETSKAIAAAEARVRESGGSASGFAAMLEEQGVPKDVFYLQTTKVVANINGEEHIIKNGDNNYGWSGTGFLLNDGRFVTARHCIEGWLYEDPTGSSQANIFARAAASYPGISIKANFIAISSLSGKQFEFSSDDFTINRSLDNKVSLGTDDDGDPVYWNFTFPAMEGMPETMWSTDWAYTTKTGGQRGTITADPELSRNLMPMQKLVVLGFPKGIGVLDGKEKVDPISSELTTSRKGLAANGCILHSSGTDHGNSGGPILAVKDGKLVVIGIVSRGDVRTEQHNWAVPIANIY